MKSVLSFLIIITCLNLWALGNQSCSTVNLPLERVGPVRNQGIAGLCFAFEGADLLSYKLGYRVSATDVAIYYFKSTKMKKMTSVYNKGGETKPSIETGLISGFCSEEAMPSDESKTALSDLTASPIYASFKWLDNNIWGDNEGYYRARNIFPYLTEEIYQQASKLASLRQRYFYVQKHSCPDRAPVREIMFRNISTEKASQVPGLIRIIDQQLEQNNIVGIGFHSNDLYQKQVEEDDTHGTTIVARRWNHAKNTCEYLMRDNFGAQCDLYPKNLDCENGYIWLSEKFLLKNLYEIDYIQ